MLLPLDGFYFSAINFTSHTPPQDEYLHLYVERGSIYSDHAFIIHYLSFSTMCAFAVLDYSLSGIMHFPESQAT